MKDFEKSIESAAIKVRATAHISFTARSISCRNLFSRYNNRAALDVDD
jgi:hypothetical protein